MKKNLLVLFTILSFTFLDCLKAQVSEQHSSNLIFNFREKDFNNAIVYLNDGTQLLGEVRDFGSPNTIEIINFDFGTPLSDIEEEINFNNKKIRFRKNENEEEIFLAAEDIDAITFFDEKLNEKVEFKRLNIYRSNTKGINEKTDRIIFAPLINDDAISTYGFSLFYGKEYGYTFFYFANGKSNDAISPYDFAILEILKKDFFKKRMISSFKFASNNCEDFINWLELKFDKVYDKDKFKKERKAFEKDIKEGKKAYKTRLEKEFYEARRYEEYYFNVYNIMIQEYKNRCN